MGNINAAIRSVVERMVLLILAAVALTVAGSGAVMLLVAASTAVWFAHTDANGLLGAAAVAVAGAIAAHVGAGIIYKLR